MEITRKHKIAAVGVGLATAFAAGRYTLPTKIKTEIKTVTVEKIVYKKAIESQKNTHKKTMVVEIIKPTGEKQTTTVTTDESVSDKKTVADKTTDTIQKQDAKQEVTGSVSKVTISALGGVNIETGLPTYGASITKPILGPVTVGIFGLSNGTAGASVGITF